MGPLLFTMYVNDLVFLINEFNSQICSIYKFDLQVYADDVQWYVSCSPNEVPLCVQHINKCLDRVSFWAQCNGLSLNPNKTKCLVISRTKCNIPVSIRLKLQNIDIEIVDKARNLGITFNNRLTWTEHISKKIGVTYGMLRTLWQTQSFTPVKIRMLLAKTYLIPTVLYGCELFVNPGQASKNSLQKLLNSTARYVFNRKKI